MCTHNMLENPKLSAELFSPITADLIIGHLHIRLQRQWETQRLNDAVGHVHAAECDKQSQC